MSIASNTKEPKVPAKRKGLNNASAKANLAKSIIEAEKNLKHDRWLASEEGKAYRANEARNQVVRDAIKIGQRVWQKVLGESDGDLLGPGNPLVSICWMITGFSNDIAETEMLYGQVGEKKFDSFRDYDGAIWAKGATNVMFYTELIKHTNKTNGNVWWEYSS